MALGDLAFEETGKFAGIRALPEGKVEATYQGTGKLFGADYSSIYTGFATPHGGTLLQSLMESAQPKMGTLAGSLGVGHRRRRLLSFEGLGMEVTNKPAGGFPIFVVKCSLST